MIALHGSKADAEGFYDLFAAQATKVMDLDNLGFPGIAECEQSSANRRADDQTPWKFTQSEDSIKQA